MALADIDADATRRRIQEIADGAKKALEAHAQRSAEIDVAAREAAAKEEADVKAVRERRAELEARRAAENQQPKPPAKPVKPSTLSLGAEEFRLERQARQAAARDGEDKTQQDKPVQKRPEADDDMSGRSWLR